MESQLTGTVLVADDNEGTLRASTDILEMEGFTVISVADGQSALRVIVEQRPDVILLDVMMPGLTGIEVLKEIRSMPDLAETPVILATVMDQPDDMVHGLEVGANDYLVKPIQSQILVARVRTQIKLKRLQDQSRSDIARMAEIDATKDRFLQIVSHDLKNPINNISLGVDLLTESRRKLEPAMPELGTILDVMRTAVTTMNMMVNDFLDHDALRSGKLELNFGPISLNHVATQVVEQFLGMADLKDISVVADFTPKLPDLRADSNRLIQVASNLVSNAVKYTWPGGTVTVRTKIVKGGQRFEVQDTGPGIGTDEMEMLFQPFVQMRNRPTGGERSSHIGLSIAHQLIELQGGRIGADSELGVGSTFWFELPE